MILPIGTSKLRVLNLVYSEPGIKLTDLIKKARISVDTSKKTLNELIESKVIEEEEIKGGKKILLRKFYPNLKTEEGKAVFTSIELERKQDFFKDHPELVGPINHLLREVSIDILIVFGSFAKRSETKDSDLDMLFISNKKMKDKIGKACELAFVTFDRNISPRIESLGKFKDNITDPLHKSIIRDHVILHGSEKFIEALSKISIKNLFA